MGNEGKGDVRIISVPTEGEGALPIINYLLGYSRNPARDRAKVKAMLQNLPAVVARNSTRQNGEKIVAALQKLGAEVVFEPADPFGQTAPEPVASSLSDPQSYHQSGAVMTTQKPSPKSGRRAAIVLMVLLAVAAAVTYQQGFWGGDATATKAAAPASKPSAKKVPTPIQAQPYILPKGDILEFYDRQHAPQFDRRLADGLAEAVREYARVFPAGDEAAKVVVDYTPEQTGVDDWRLTYQISMDQAQAKVEVALTNDPDKIAQNIPALEKALAEMVKKMKGHAKPVEQIEITGGNSGSVFKVAMEKMSSKSIVDALAVLGENVGPDGVEPGAFHAAGDLLAWLAYIKSAHDRPNQNQIIAPYAVANHLLASLFAGGQTPGMTRSRGLLWIGLGYPSAALSTISTLKDPESELVSVMAKRDTDRLKVVAKKAKVPNMLASYLDARLTNEMHYRPIANKKYDHMRENYPQFMFGTEYTIIYGGVGYAGFAEGNLEMVGSVIMQLVTERLDLSPTLAWSMIGTSISMITDEEGDHNVGFLSIQKKMLDGAISLKGGDRILTRDLLVNYLGEENKDAAYLCFYVEKNVYARMGAMKRWSDIIGKVWPNSSVAHLTAIAYERSTNDYKRINAQVNRVSLDSADASLLEEIAEFYIWNSQDMDKVAKGMMTLGAMRAKTNPTPKEMRNSAYIHLRHRISPVARDYYHRARLLDPYNPASYWHNFNGATETISDEHVRVMERSAEYLRLGADWMVRNERDDEAIRFYEKAMTLSKENAYQSGLVRILKKRKEYTKAERILKEYLKQDDGSFHFIQVNNKLADIYLAQGKNKQAFELMDKNKDSWQGWTMRLYAQAAEVLGKMDLAEDWLLKGADRYQAGDSPVDLAMFYLRQGDHAKAVRTLQKYRKYNHHSYYFKEAISFFKKNGTPEKIFDLVAAVEGKEVDRFSMAGLYGHLMKAELYGLAAEASRPLMAGKPTDAPHFNAMDYIQASKMANPAGMKAAVAEALDALSVDKRRWLGLAMLLHKNGYYKEAFGIFPMWAKAFPKKRDNATVMMAMSWKAAGGKDQKMKETIEARLQAPDVDKWKGALAAYYLGRIPEADVVAAMTDRNRAVQAFHAMAMGRLAKGEEENAEKLMVMTLETRMSGYLDYNYAYSFLKERAYNEY